MARVEVSFREVNSRKDIFYISTKQEDLPLKKTLFYRLAALGLSLALLLAGCGGTPEPVDSPKPTATPTPTPTPVAAEFALACYPDAGYHPITGFNRTNLLLGGLLYEGLFAVDPQFDAEEVLCSSYTMSSDGLTWTFTLRSGVTFSDGSPLTTAEVLSSLELARTSTLYSARFTDVTEITAGEGTVTITLSRANGVLPSLLDIPIVKETEGGVPLGTGPYVITGSGEDLSLTANSHWWRGEELPRDSIPLRGIQETDDLIHAFDTREISLVGTDLTATGALGFSGTFNTVDYPTANMVYVGFNTTSGPCASAAVRKALLKAFDREAVATGIYSRHAVAATLPLHPESSFYPSSLGETVSYSPREVEQALAQAGWSGGTTLELVVSSENQDRVAAAQSLADDLNDLGIQITLTKLEWTDYLAALQRRDFDLYLGEVRLTADFDLTALITPGGALNYGGYNNQEAVDALNSYRAATGQGRGWSAKNLCSELLEDPPFAVLCFKNWSALTQWSGITHMTPTQQNLFYHFWEWEIAG